MAAEQPKKVTGGAFGQFLAEMTGQAYLLQGMGESGTLPFLFAERSRYGTPTYSILFNYTVIMFLVNLDLTTLVELVNVFYIFSMFLEVAAFMAYRINEPERERPYKIPLGVGGCALLVSPLLGFSLLMLYIMWFHDEDGSSAKAIWISIGMVVVGTALYYLLQCLKRLRMVRFSSPPSMAEVSYPLAECTTLSQTSA